MKAVSSLITLGVLLSVLGFGAPALADESSVFEPATSDSNLEAPKLTVTIEGNQVTLSWNKVAGATDYVVHYAQYPYDHPGTIQTLAVGDKTTASLDLSPGDAYLFAARACTDSGSDCSDYSIIHDVKIPLTSTFKNSLGQEFKLIPAGTFMMGSPDSELARRSDETQHQVTLTQPFYMQTTEVTQGQWKKVMGDNPSHFQSCGDDCPVEQVSWNDVKEFINKLNGLESTDNYRLPTEAEWEYACRAGSTVAYANGPMAYYLGEVDPILDQIGWYVENSNDKTHPVAQKIANAWGLYDMHGNVYEYCQDWYYYYPPGPVTDPIGPPYNPEEHIWNKVNRGGSCLWWRGACRSAERSELHPDARYADRGFRLVMQLR